MRKSVKVALGAVLAFTIPSVTGFMFRDRIWRMMLLKKPGNGSLYRLENVRRNSGSPLKGKTIIFLGSSVTKGEAALGISFVEYVERIDGIIPIKEAVSGTTLVTDGDTDGVSYIPRMENIDPNLQADCFVCQLSTNDATQGKKLGAVSDSFDRVDFDKSTVAGAIEYIISYARDTWHCPVFFYTGTKYDSAAYGQMVDLLLTIQQKWGIVIIDLWNSEEMNRVSKQDYSLYMADKIHPTQAGYLLWWTPQFERHLVQHLE